MIGVFYTNKRWRKHLASLDNTKWEIKLYTNLWKYSKMSCNDQSNRQSNIADNKGKRKTKHEWIPPPPLQKGGKFTREKKNENEQIIVKLSMEIMLVVIRTYRNKSIKMVQMLVQNYTHMHTYTHAHTHHIHKHKPTFHHFHRFVSI